MNLGLVEAIKFFVLTLDYFSIYLPIENINNYVVTRRRGASSCLTEAKFLFPPNMVVKHKFLRKGRFLT